MLLFLRLHNALVLFLPPNSFTSQTKIEIFGMKTLVPSGSPVIKLDPDHHFHNNYNYLPMFRHYSIEQEVMFLSHKILPEVNAMICKHFRQTIWQKCWQFTCIDSKNNNVCTIRNLKIYKLLPPYTLPGFDLTTLISCLLSGRLGGDDTTRPRLPGQVRNLRTILRTLLFKKIAIF
jgi:hypothetical protein